MVKMKLGLRAPSHRLWPSSDGLGRTARQSCSFLASLPSSFLVRFLLLHILLPSLVQFKHRLTTTDICDQATLPQH